MSLQRFHRQDLNSDVDLVSNKKGHMLHKKIECNKRILAKLNFDSDPVFHKIGLIV